MKLDNDKKELSSSEFWQEFADCLGNQHCPLHVELPYIGYACFATVINSVYNLRQSIITQKGFKKLISYGYFSKLLIKCLKINLSSPSDNETLKGH
ncbi:hypothetical protein T01_15829 [Trichinella spiralis]|uniref:Uncharacterized protein n=1 Tax=Trichinella spiralis TaxID=6334 RepID=A0A0V1BUY3_TRISP|nr:hypothetical protein T01_15829 [Trichinella spiralis]